MMSGFTHQGPYLILQLLPSLTLILIMPMPMLKRMHTLCSLQEVQQELMRYHSMALLLPLHPLAPRTSRTQLWHQ